MRQVRIEDFPEDVQQAVRKAANGYPHFGPGCRVCIGDRQQERFAEVELANNAQVSALAVELVKLGYLLSNRKEDECEFMLEADGQ
jgi:hypothetical protein